MRRDPKIEVFIGKHAGAWRLYTQGWAPPYLRAGLDQSGEAFPVAEPDLRALDAFMFALDAPYLKRVAANGDVELDARGRAAIVLAEWLDGLLA